MKKSKQFKFFLRKVISIIKQPEMRILPGQLAFFLVISIIPLIALVGSIASRFGLPATSIKDTLSTILPHNIVDYFISTNQNILSFNVTVFFIAAFILASNGPYSIINTSNEIYKVNNKSEIYKRLKAVLMTFILVTLLIFLVLVPVFGDTLVKLISSSIENITLTNILEGLYHICKYPISLIVIYYNLKLLYQIAPDTNINSKEATYGAIFTTVMWLLSSKIYAFYVDYFSNYDVFYGAMSNILVLLIWVYILSYIFTLGMCFNRAGIIEETLKLKREDIDKELKKDN